MTFPGTKACSVKATGSIVLTAAIEEELPLAAVPWVTSAPIMRTFRLLATMLLKKKKMDKRHAAVFNNSWNATWFHHQVQRLKCKTGRSYGPFLQWFACGISVIFSWAVVFSTPPFAQKGARGGGGGALGDFFPSMATFHFWQNEMERELFKEIWYLACHNVLDEGFQDGVGVFWMAALRGSKCALAIVERAPSICERLLYTGNYIPLCHYLAQSSI